MNEDGHDDGEPGQLRQEAATWFARMRGPDADNHRGAFDDWLARGAVHRSAYNRIAEIFSAGKLLKDDPQTAFRRRTPVVLGAMLLGPAVVSLLLVVFGFAPERSLGPLGDTTKSIQIVSVIGQVRRVALADGSLITLDSDTLLSVHFDRSSRLLRLVRGRARFEVRHDGRPFTVIAGDERVVARGTVFDIDLQDRGGVNVVLLRGVVEVTKLDHATGRALKQNITLRPGQRLVGSLQQNLPRPVAIGAEADWTRQLAVFHRALLADVVSAANRYNLDKIVIADPAIARLRVSGTFRIVEAPPLCEKLGALFGLIVDRQTPGIIVLRRKPPE